LYKLNTYYPIDFKWTVEDIKKYKIYIYSMLLDLWYNIEALEMLFSSLYIEYIKDLLLEELKE
jgi:hypothetical protein